MSKYFLTDTAVKMFCPGNVMQLDDAGLPSILVYIPKFKNSDVLTGGDDNTHPAFIVNDKEIDGFYYSKYQNVVHNGKAYSLPGEAIPTSISFDNALKYSEAKGYGWHLSTAAEWAAIALWSKANGFQPYGNNSNGKDSRETEYKAIPARYNADGTIAAVATGTGPLTWSHDRTASGIWDMNGNAAEFVGGVRLVWGELQILKDNDAADTDNPQSAKSACWKAINAADGSLVEPESRTTDTAAKLEGNTVRFDLVDNIWTYCTTVTNPAKSYFTCQFSAIKCTEDISEATKRLLRSLALLPEEAQSSDYGGDTLYVERNREVMLYRGGQENAGTAAGIFNASFAIMREASTKGAGFRAAYIPEII